MLLDRKGRVVLCNDAARELLGLHTDPQGLAADALSLVPELTAAMVSPEAHLEDKIYVGDTRVLVINTAPVRSRDHVMGNVVTLRDHTELQALSGELNTVREFAESLHAQAHEAANRLHTPPPGLCDRVKLCGRVGSQGIALELRGWGVYSGHRPTGLPLAGGGAS